MHDTNGDTASTTAIRARYYGASGDMATILRVSYADDDVQMLAILHTCLDLKIIN
jgi:hypothetical protein